MDMSESFSRHRKRARRRRPDKPPLSARLLMNNEIETSHVLLSEDLYIELFPELPAIQEAEPYIAVTPWFPQPDSTLHRFTWTIAPAAKASNQKQPFSSIWISPEAVYLKGLLQALRQTNASTDLSKASGLEVRIIDVCPLYLDTVYVRLDQGVQARLLDGTIDPGQAWDSIERTRPSQRKGKEKPEPAAKGLQGSSSESLTIVKDVVQRALRAIAVVHSGDAVPLPLPSHPITYALPPPAKIIHCEPVSQGRISASTRIVVLSTKLSHQVKRNRPAPLLTAKFSAEDAVEDTSEDYFYSAAESRTHSRSNSSSGNSAVEDFLETSDSSSVKPKESDEEESSDDSFESLITLSGPTLPDLTSLSGNDNKSIMSRTRNGRRDGASTPGSILSNLTSVTVREHGKSGRLFKACELDRPIQDSLLHPRPLVKDDPETRIYVEVASLAKIGCFSGDWVKVEPEVEQEIDQIGSWELAFQSIEERLSNWKALKIYGLPEMYSLRRHGLGRAAHPHTSTTPAPQVFFSPVLLSNMQTASRFRISPLPCPDGHSVTGSTSSHISRSKRARIPNHALPPSAREVKLSMIASPLSTDRTVQPAIWAALKGHFEKKQRILKNFDLLAVSVDVNLGRILYSAGGSSENTEADSILPDLLSSGQLQDSHRRSLDVIWFQANNIVSDIEQRSKDSDSLDTWNSAATVDPTSTRLVQSGTQKAKLPPTLQSKWQVYLNGCSSSFEAGRRPAQIKASSVRRQLRELFAACTTPRALHLGLKPLAVLLTSTQRSIGKATITQQACADIGLHLFEIDTYEILAEGGSGGTDIKTEAYLKARADRAISCGPENCALLVRHIEALDSERMATAIQEIIESLRVFVATTTDVEKIPDSLRSLFTHELEVNAPHEKEREDLMHTIIEERGLLVSSDLDLASVAVKTAALVAGDLVDVVDRAVIAQQYRLEGILTNSIKAHEDLKELNIRDIHVSGGPKICSLTRQDFTAAVDTARKNFADAIGAPKIPNVTWDDVGGLSHVKDAVMETIQLPLERPELFAKGMKKRSGILFYGPPGTGKTLLAKAIATEFSLNFFSVKGPELLNMYIGESEANVRRVFQRARDARPCVVFFDELDSVAPKRGNQGDSGGVMDRIVSQLLAELDGMSNGEENAGGVFVIGATNRPDLLDAALLRPGRFDKMIYLGISDTHEKQLTILEALTRKFTLHPSVSLRSVVEKLPFTYTGADLYALCSDAMLKAITRQASLVDQKIATMTGPPVTTAQFFDNYASKEDVAVMVTEQDFTAAQTELVGSVSAKELEHYEKVQKSFEITRGDGGAPAKGETSAANHASSALSIRRKPNSQPINNGHVSEPSKTSAAKKLSLNAKKKGKRKAQTSNSNGDFEDPSADDSELYD